MDHGLSSAVAEERGLPALVALPVGAEEVGGLQGLVGLSVPQTGLEVTR